MAVAQNAVYENANESTPVAFFLPSVNRSDSDEEFWQLCLANPELRFERNDDGSVVIMTPTGWESGRQNSRISQQLANWCDRDGSGEIGDSNSLYRIFKGSRRAPDASWILKSRLETVSLEDRKKVLPIAPDFVIELRSPSDAIASLRSKMHEYMSAGVRLGWLIDPETRSVEIYRPGKEVERMENATTVSGDPELKGFVLDLGKIW